jgi:large subunit ribosomal protein L2
MPNKRPKPTTPGRRNAILPDFSRLTTSKPYKPLLAPIKKTGGRNHSGRITVRHIGGGHKRRYRLIDFARNKMGVPAKVVTREYDPNRSSWIMLIQYMDGERRYIVCPVLLEVDDVIVSGETAEAKPGNAMMLKNIPSGQLVHCIEFFPGGKAKLARSAGTYAQVMGLEEDMVRLRLPSGEIRLFKGECMATIGQVSNVDHKHVKSGKAGRSRHLGIRPTVRGTAMNPVDHPHGGGEGRGYVGGPPRTFAGKLAKGVRTRKRNKPSDALIVTRARDARRRRK